MAVWSRPPPRSSSSHGVASADLVRRGCVLLVCINPGASAATGFHCGNPQNLLGGAPSVGLTLSPAAAAEPTSSYAGIDHNFVNRTTGIARPSRERLPRRRDRSARTVELFVSGRRILTVSCYRIALGCVRSHRPPTLTLEGSDLLFSRTQSTIRVPRVSVRAIHGVARVPLSGVPRAHEALPDLILRWPMATSPRRTSSGGRPRTRCREPRRLVWFRAGSATASEHRGGPTDGRPPDPPRESKVAIGGFSSSRSSTRRLSSGAVLLLLPRAQSARDWVHPES